MKKFLICAVVMAMVLCPFVFADTQDFLPDDNGAYTIFYNGVPSREYVLKIIEGIYDEGTYLDALFGATDEKTLYFDTAVSDKEGVVTFENFIPALYKDGTVVVAGEGVGDAPLLLGYLRADNLKSEERIFVSNLEEKYIVDGNLGEDVEITLDVHLYDSLGYETFNFRDVNFEILPQDDSVVFDKETNTIKIGAFSQTKEYTLVAKSENDVQDRYAFFVEREKSVPFEIKIFEDIEKIKPKNEFTVKGVAGEFESIEFYPKTFDQFGDAFEDTYICKINGQVISLPYTPENEGEKIITVHSASSDTVLCEVKVSVIDRPDYQGEALLLYQTIEKANDELSKIGTDVFVSAESGKDIYPDSKWTTEKSVDTLLDKISESQSVLEKYTNGSVSQSSVKSSRTKLESAINTYVKSIKAGVRIDASSIKLSQTQASLAYGRYVTLKATLSPTKNTEKVTWSSSDESVAVVSSTGKVTATGNGECEIYAYTRAGIFAVCKVSAYTPIVKVSFEKSSLSMLVGGDDITLGVSAMPEDHTDSLLFESSNDDIATVDQNGKVTAVSPGKAKITVSSNSGKKATCTITVGLEADSVEFKNVKTTSVAVGSKLSLSANAFRADGKKPMSTKTYFEVIENNGSGGDDAVVIDKNGRITGLSVGSAIIRAYAQDSLSGAYADIEISVCIPVKTIKFAQSKISLAEGGKNIVLSPTVTPQNHSETLFYEISDEAVAKVLDDGTVIPLGVGKATITYKSQSGAKASVQITVGLGADAVNFTPVKSTLLAAGKSITLKASAFRLDGQKPVSTEVVYEIVSGQEFASINEKGVLKGISTGQVVVRATPMSATLDAQSEQITIDVYKPVTSLKFKKSTLPLGLGLDGVNLDEYLTISPLDHSESISFEVANSDVAFIDENNNVVPKSTGKTKITAISSGGKKATLTVNVGLCADKVTITEPKSNSIAQGKTLTLKATASRLDGQKPVSSDVVWSSEDQSIATVDEKGKVTAIGVGTVTITAKSFAGDASESIEIVVVPTLQNVVANQGSITLGEGDELDIMQNVSVVSKDSQPIDIEKYCTVSFRTSSASKVEISEDGIIKAVKEGKATVYVTVQCSGVKKTATIVVTVVKASESAQLLSDENLQNKKDYEEFAPDFALMPEMCETSAEK